MTLAERLVRGYFNLVYNPVYDLTTGRISRYQKLQLDCISKLSLQNSNKVLCVGVGTGNEIRHILKANPTIGLTGIDYSEVALAKANRKAQSYGKKIEFIHMDAQHLDFPSQSFDRILCIHLMDFVPDQSQATGEILRVLKDSGRFVITYPSKSEGAGLGMNLLKDNIQSRIDSGRSRFTATVLSILQMIPGMVYLPLILRPKKHAYLRDELTSLISGFGVSDFLIEDEPMYYDFIVYGSK